MTVPDPFDAPLPDWAPSAADVRDEMPGRKVALDRLDDAELEELIRRRVQSLTAELPTVLATRLWGPARDYITFAVAAILEDRLFPEQANLPESNAARLDRRAGAELTRLRTGLGESGSDTGGAEWSGTISIAGPPRLSHRGRRW